MKTSETEIDALDRKPPLPFWFKATLGALALALLGFVVLVLNSFEPPDTRFDALVELQENEREPSGEDDHDTLRVAHEIPAKQQPELLPLSALPDTNYAERRVIGVADGDLAQAYVIKPVPRQRHVLLISTKIGDRPLVISHNYQKNRTRVFTSEDSTELLDVQIGGVDWPINLVYLYQGVRYVESSKKFPLPTFPFEVTTLDKWVEKHPDTLINFDEEVTEKDYYQYEGHGT